MTQVIVVGQWPFLGGYRKRESAEVLQFDKSYRESACRRDMICFFFSLNCQNPKMSMLNTSPALRRFPRLKNHLLAKDNRLLLSECLHAIQTSAVLHSEIFVFLLMIPPITKACCTVVGAETERDLCSLCRRTRNTEQKRHAIIRASSNSVLSHSSEPGA